MKEQAAVDIASLVGSLRSWRPWVRWAAQRRFASLDLEREATRPALGALLAAWQDPHLRDRVGPALAACLRRLTEGAPELQASEAADLRRALFRASPLREPDMVMALLRAVGSLQDTGAIAAVAEVIEKTTFRGDDLAQYAEAPPWPPRVSAAREPANPEVAHQLRQVNAAARAMLARLERIAAARSRTDPLLRPSAAPSPPPEALLRPAHPAAEAAPERLLRPSRHDH